MPTPCIIRIDSVQRYCDIMAGQLPGKRIYADLTEVHGRLWKNYSRFTYWRFRYRNHIPDTPRGRFLMEYNSRLTGELMPSDVFNLLRDDYGGMHTSCANFLKLKSNYQKKGIVNI